MGAKVFRLVHAVAVDRCCQFIRGDEARGKVVRISEPPKSRPQEEKYHAMIAEIADQCEFLGRKWDREEWKRMLIDAFVRAERELAKQEGRPDPFDDQGQVVPSLDGRGIVQLGVQSRKFTKGLAAKFIEFLFWYGAEHGAEFADDAS